ncbi:MAG: hypothetical protein ACRDL1_05280, partial [Solirubrobacterales bacterium]
MPRTSQTCVPPPAVCRPEEDVTVELAACEQAAARGNATERTSGSPGRFARLRAVLPRAPRRAVQS